MTRNKSHDTLKPIAGGNPNGALGGSTGNGNLESTANFVVQGTLEKDQYAVFDGVHWINKALDLSQVDPGYDPTKGYENGALATFGGKIYQAKERPDLAKDPLVPDGERDFVWMTGKETIDEWYKKNVAYTGIYNRGPDYTFTDGPLAGQTLPHGQTAITLGWPPYAGDVDLGPDGKYWGGYMITPTAGRTLYTKANADKLNAEYMKWAKVAPGVTPTTNPEKWVEVGGGDSTKLEELADFLKDGTLETGQHVTWNGTKWTNTTPLAQLAAWSSTHTYGKGDVVAYQGSFWQAAKEALNKKPSTGSTYWTRLDMGYVRWQPNTAYPKGTIAIVPSDVDFFTNWDANDLVTNDCDHYSLWVAAADITGNLPVAAGAPVSVSAVCPGTWVPTDKTGTVDPGVTVFCDNWIPLTSPSFYVVDDLAALYGFTFDGPWIYGSIALVLKGDGAGHLFRFEKQLTQVTNDGYMGNVGRHCWTHVGALAAQGGGGLSSSSELPVEYDHTKAYKPGALAVWNKKVWQAIVPNPAYPSGWNTNVAVWTQSGGTLDAFFAGNLRFSFWTNTGTTPVQTGPDHLGDIAIPAGSTLYCLGLPPEAPSITLGGVTFPKGGCVVSTTQPFAALTAADVTALEAAAKAYNTLSPNQSPFNRPNNWQLVGEPNDITKTEMEKYVDDQLAPVVSGMEHGASVLDIVNTPDPKAANGAFYIVGTKPTGDFAGHANAVAFLEGHAWKFTDPQANEAHLNEKDNTIYHWSGTAWNKVGTVAPMALDNLTDVDTVKTAPKTGDLLMFDGTNWVPKDTSRDPITKGFNPHISANDTFIDLEYDNWQALDIQALIEIADNPCHLGFRLLNGLHQIVLSRNDCQRAAQRLAWGSERTHDARLIPYKQNTYFGDEYTFGLTWLPGANGGSDRFKPSDYAILRLTMCRTYDNYIIIDGAMFYNSYGNEGYDMQSKFAVTGVGVSQVKSIGFHCHGGPSRIAVNGQYTMTPHA